MADDTDQDLERLPLWVSETVVGYIWPLEDTPSFIAGRVATAARALPELVGRFPRRYGHTPSAPCAARCTST